MTGNIYKTTGALITAFENIFRSKFQIRNLGNVTNHPTLFVPNHFIRLETFIIPYVLYKHTQKTPRSLGDKSLFTGILGRFLTALGSISTAQVNRNRIIISDLLKGQLDWVIYPEGFMVKSKSVIDKKGYLIIQTPKGNDVPKTGSAVLALKTEIIKWGLKKHLLKKKTFLNQVKNKYDVYPHQINHISLKINPVNITYYPLRPGENKISRVFEKIFNDIPEHIKEEIKVESQLIFKSDVDITFAEPIDVYKIVKPWLNLFNILPLSMEKKSNLIVRLLYKSLTKKMMRAIYHHLTINIDHLFCFYLFNVKKGVLDLHHLKYFIFKVGYDIRTKNLNYHSSLKTDFHRLLTEECHSPFASILNFAFKSGALSKREKEIIINKKWLFSNNDFHSIRLENTIRVIYNEMKVLKNLHKTLNKSLNSSKKKLESLISDFILNLDLMEYNEDYKKNYKLDFSKDISVGRPFYFKKRSKNKKNKIGLLLSHGYKSAPLEILELAKHLSDKDISVYGVRLKGHGTHPLDLKQWSWQDWYNSYLKGLVALNADCEKVIVGGFSTGGILALLSASRNPSLVDGVISINAPLKLQDIKTKLTPAINFWNELLDLTNIEKGKLEYVEDSPEYPEINYSRNYLKGVMELEKLMKVCREELKKIIAPTLIIQSKKDPVVKPESANIIYQNLNSDKKLLTLDLDNHVIVRGRGKEKVFSAVEQFITSF